MVHRVVRDLAALFELTRHTRTVLLDAVAALKERRLRAALLESVEQIVRQAVRIVFALAGRAVVEGQRDINVRLRNVAVHRVAQTAAQRVEVVLLAVQTVKREGRERERAVTQVGIVPADDFRERRRGNVEAVLVGVEPYRDVVARDAAAADLEAALGRNRGLGVVVVHRPDLVAVKLRRAAERRDGRLERHILGAVLLHDALAQLFAVRRHGLGLPGNERLIRVGAHEDAVARDLLFGRAEHARDLIRYLRDLFLGQLILLRNNEEIALFLCRFGGLPRERLAEALRRNVNHAVLYRGRGRHFLAFLAHLHLGARRLDFGGLLVPCRRAALSRLVPCQVELELVAERLERCKQIAAAVAVGRPLKVERFSVTVAERVVHLIDNLVAAAFAERRAYRRGHEFDRQRNQRDQKHDHQCQHAVMAFSFPAASAGSRIAVRRIICHFEFFPSCLLHPR